MSCFAVQSAQAIAASRANLTDAAPVFVYLFNRTLAAIQELAPLKGCEHGSELFLVFDVKQVLDSEEQTLADAFVE